MLDLFTDANLQTEKLINELHRLAERPIVPDSSWVVVPDIGSPDTAFSTRDHSEFRSDPSEANAVIEPVESINGTAIISPNVSLSDVQIGTGDFAG
jgi:hypothetical protein